MRDRRQRRGGTRSGRGAWRASLLLCLLVGACGVPDEVNPVSIYDRISGKADANRLPPPGMDQPAPSLASIPPRPERPSPEFRQAVTDALASDRARSREPLLLRSVPAPGATGGVAPGEPPMPVAPPGRPVLAAAPAIPWTEAPTRPRPQPGATAPPEGKAGPAAPALPEVPEEAPAAPPPELLGPPPRP